MTAAELRALLRAHPAEALEAMADVRIAEPWAEVPLIDRWVRAPWRGYIWRDTATGVCRVWDSRRRRLVCSRPTIAEAQAAADAHLLAEGWVLVPDGPVWDPIVAQAVADWPPPGTFAVAGEPEE